MKKLFKNKTLNFFLVILFTVFMLWLMLKDNFDEVSELLNHVQLSWFFVVVGAVLFYQLIIGMILMVLARISNKEYHLGKGFVNAIIASFFHGVTPSASGGQFAQVYVFGKQGIPVSDSAGILWMDFILYQGTMVGMVFILLALRFNYFYTNFSNLFIVVIFGFIINSLVIVGLWALARFPKVYTWITNQGIEIGAKIHLIKNKEKTIENINLQLNRFGTETKQLQSHKKELIQVVVLNILRLLVYYMIPYYCALALGISVDSSLVIDIIALSSCVSMVNAFIPIPGASGGTEATFVLMFGHIFGKIKATSIMLLWRFTTYYLIMAIGGIVFVGYKYYVTKKESKLEKGEF